MLSAIFRGEDFADQTENFLQGLLGTGMSILSKLGKKLGLSGQEKGKRETDDANRDVFNLNKEPIPEPIAEAMPAPEPVANSVAEETTTEGNPATEAGPKSEAESEPALTVAKGSFVPEPAKTEPLALAASDTFEGPGLAQIDSDLLTKLYKQGANLSIPRHAMFFLYFPTEEAAKTAQNALGFHPMSQASGFQVTVDLEPSPTGWLCLLQLDLVVNRESISHVRTDLESLAAQLGGVFEGWEASLQAA